MRLGGVIFASLGLLIVVLVTNGRWSTVWAAMLGTTGSSSGGSGGSSSSSDAGSWGTADDTQPYSTPTGGGW